MLGSAVGRQVIEPGVSRRGGNRDDARMGVFAVRYQHGRGGFDQTPGTENIHRHDGVPRGVVYLPERSASSEHAGTRDHGVQSSKVSCRRLDRELHVGGTSHVAHEPEDDLTVTGHDGVEIDLRRQGVGNVGNVTTAVDGHHAVVLIHQRIDRRGTDAPCGARDDGDPTH